MTGHAWGGLTERKGPGYMSAVLAQTLVAELGVFGYPPEARRVHPRLGVEI